MSYNLLIVESPTKAKTIGKYLGDEYKVVATVGHLRDLPKSKLGIDIEKDFELTYAVDKEKKGVVEELLKAAKGAKKIFLATDPDREGEAISWHVAHIITENPKSKIKDSNISRVTFHEITKDAVAKAVAAPRNIYLDLVDAQQARRVLDRLVGYKVSPVLWKKVRRGLSAGRVQSVAVRLICEREKEIEAFLSERYFRAEMEVEKNGQKFVASLVEFSGKRVDISTKIQLFDGEYSYSKTIFSNKSDLEKLEGDRSEVKVVSVEEKEVERKPLPPYTTSKLQQAGSSRFGWSGKLTMSVAQKLYEKGWISYHRTDSTYLSPEAVSAFRKHIAEKYGADYVPEKPWYYATKSKNAQEAHEAIRPTDASREPSHLADARERKLYELIAKRAIASQASVAVVAKTIVDLSQGDATYRSEGVSIVFDGYLKISAGSVEEQTLPKMERGDVLVRENLLVSEHTTSPPPRYSDASLVGSLERQGIGRPSTYAPIISTIVARQYVEKEEGRYRPTALGQATNTFLVTNFPEVLSLPFTANMEENLDKIAEGEVKWKSVIADFWGPFAKTLEKVEETAERVKVEVEKTGRICPKCEKNELVVRSGRFGKFIACSGFPDCKHTEQIKEKVDFLCPTCGKEVLVKRTKKGRKFFGCSDYPNCKWAGWKKP